ncbi:hypothetical protein ACHEXK_06085 [Limnohabitans sp. DCL3]|uniref:hypothetical protein n=1 Tax=Limnohabitans sp. DCL3 TaxID=3374103 RepID=UPI003A85AC20
MTQKTAHRPFLNSKIAFAPTLIALSLGLSVLLPINAQAGCNAQCAFRKVSKPIKTVANGGIKFATNQGQQLASFTQDEFNFVRNSSTTLMNETSAGLNNAYDATMSSVSQFFTAELEKLLRQQGKAFVRKNGTTINRIGSGVNSMSDQARAAIKRIVKAMPSKQMTSNVMADLQLLSKELGFTELGGSAKNSSWGITFNTDAGIGPAGVATGIGIALNVLPESDGSVKGALLTNIGAAGGIDAGVAQSVTIFWQPGTASESTGLALGFSMAGGVEGLGMGLDLSFGIPVDGQNYKSMMTWGQGVVSSLIPSVAFTVDIPGLTPTIAHVSYDMNLGWTQKVIDFTISPSDLCQFTSSVVNGVTSTKLMSSSSCPGAAADAK